MFVILSSLRSLKVNNWAGMDKLHSRLLRETREETAEPLIVLKQRWLRVHLIELYNIMKGLNSANLEEPFFLSSALMNQEIIEIIDS